MLRKPRSHSATTRRPAALPAFQDTPRLLSSDEKRGLILAHAARRAPQDPLQRMSLWIGVTVAVLVIAGGWFSTVGWQVKSAVSQGGADLKNATQQLNEFSDQVEGSQLFKSPILESPTAKAAAAELGGRIINALEAAATGTAAERAGDLMAPQAPGVSSSSVAGNAAEPGPPIDPRTPGLVPAEESAP